MIAVLVPSRGRPDRAALMATSALQTSEDAEVHIIVDPDDDTLADYKRMEWGDRTTLHTLPAQVGYTASLNAVAHQLWNRHSILGAFGDDVIFRSAGWERIVEETLAAPGIAYGDDLIHGANHPTAVFMSSVIAKALGWLALPATRHQWADDAWKRLGQETGLLRFMPDVVVEHMHPVAGKAEWDEGYKRVFDTDAAKLDFEGFSDWETNRLKLDVARVRDALGQLA